VTKSDSYDYKIKFEENQSSSSRDTRIEVRNFAEILYLKFDG